MNAFKVIDLFATPFPLKFQNQLKYPTILGGILTLLIVAISIAVAISSGDRIYNRTKPQINRNLLYREPLVYSIFDFLPFYFQLDSDYTFDSTVFNIKLMQYLKYNKINEETGEKTSVYERVEVEWEPCSDNLNFHITRFNNFSRSSMNTTLETNGISNGICIKNSDVNRNIKIGGEYESDYYSSIYLDILKCQDSDFIVCKPEQELSEIIKSINFRLIYSSYIVNTEEFDFPFNFIIDSNYIKLDYSFFFQINSYFYPIDIISDVGLLFTSYMKQEELTIDTLTATYSSYLPSDNKLGRWYINITTTLERYSRYYMKLHELAAAVGGVSNFLMFTSLFTSSVFNRFLREEEMINNFFSMDIILSKNPNIDMFPSFNNDLDDHKLKSKIKLFNDTNLLENCETKLKNNSNNDLHLDNDKDNSDSKVSGSEGKIKEFKEKVVNNCDNCEKFEYKENNLENCNISKLPNAGDNSELSIIKRKNFTYKKFKKIKAKQISSKENENSDKKIENKKSKNYVINSNNKIEIELNKIDVSSRRELDVNNNVNKISNNKNIENNYVFPRSSLVYFKKSIFSTSPFNKEKEFQNNTAIISKVKTKKIQDIVNNDIKSIKDNNNHSNIQTTKQINNQYAISYLDIIGILFCSKFCDKYSKKQKFHKILNAYLLSIVDYEEIITETSIFKELRSLGYLDKFKHE